MKTYLYVFFFLFVFVACKNNIQKTTATIIERRFINDSTIKVAYTYNIDGKNYIDSTEVKNKNIVSDTVFVIYSNDKPPKVQIDFK